MYGVTDNVDVGLDLSTAVLPQQVLQGDGQVRSLKGEYKVYDVSEEL